MPRAVEIAVRFMDRGHHPGVDPPPPGQKPGAVDRAPLSAALGVHTAKAAVTRHATPGHGDPGLAGAGVSEDRPPREAREGSYLLGDATGVSNQEQIGRRYAPKGQTPVVRRTAKKISTSMISAVNNRGLMRFMCFRGALNASLFIKFLRRLIKGATGKTFLIVDNLRVHRSVKVSKWVAGHNDQIELFFLPPYAPEYNPDEYLNNDLKQKLKNLPRPGSHEELVQGTTSVPRSLQRSPHKIRAYFHHKDVRYAA